VEEILGIAQHYKGG